MSGPDVGSQEWNEARWRDTPLVFNKSMSLSICTALQDIPQSGHSTHVAASTPNEAER